MREKAYLEGERGEREGCVGQTGSVSSANKKRTTERNRRVNFLVLIKMLSSLDQSPVYARKELHSSNVLEESNVFRIVLAFNYYIIDVAYVNN